MRVREQRHSHGGVSTAMQELPLAKKLASCLTMVVHT